MKRKMKEEEDDDSPEHEAREMKEKAMGTLLSALKESKSVKKVSPRMTKGK